MLNRRPSLTIRRMDTDRQAGVQHQAIHIKNVSQKEDGMESAEQKIMGNMNAHQYAGMLASNSSVKTGVIRIGLNIG